MLFNLSTLVVIAVVVVPCPRLIVPRCYGMVVLWLGTPDLGSR